MKNRKREGFGKGIRAKFLNQSTQEKLMTVYLTSDLIRRHNKSMAINKE